jgi:hypothetical protein
VIERKLLGSDGANAKMGFCGRGVPQALTLGSAAHSSAQLKQRHTDDQHISRESSDEFHGVNLHCYQAKNNTAFYGRFDVAGTLTVTYTFVQIKTSGLPIVRQRGGIAPTDSPYRATSSTR